MVVAIGPALEACGSSAVAYLNLHTVDHGTGTYLETA